MRNERAVLMRDCGGWDSISVEDILNMALVLEFFESASMSAGIPVTPFVIAAHLCGY